MHIYNLNSNIMNFSDLIQQSGGIVKYSFSGDLVAVAKNFEVKVLKYSSLNIIDL